MLFLKIFHAADTGEKTESGLFSLKKTTKFGDGFETNNTNATIHAHVRMCSIVRSIELNGTCYACVENAL